MSDPWPHGAGKGERLNAPGRQVERAARDCAGPSADPLDATVRRPVDQVKEQQGQIDRLREQLQRGG